MRFLQGFAGRARAAAAVSVLPVLALLAAPLSAAAQGVKLGAATYFLTPKGSDAAMPGAPLRTEAMRQRAVPTNQWYSTLAFNAEPEVIYAQPLTYRATRAGFEMALPGKEVVPTDRRDVEIRYPHRDPMQISPVAFEPGQAQLGGAGDWSAQISMARGADDFHVTIAHGSPFAYFQISRGDVRLRLPAPAERVGVVGGIGDSADPRVLALRVNGKTYALFGPSGVRWEQMSASEWIGHLPAAGRYLSAAALPDDQPATLALFTAHAYAFIEDTRVDWHVERATSQVETTFKAITRTMEGAQATPLLGLYPHQWNASANTSATVQATLAPAFDSVRGRIKLLAAAEFKTLVPYTGFVPFWPGVSESPKLDLLRDLMKVDERNARRMMLEEGKGPYWQGKGLQRIVALLNVAEQQGDPGARDELLKKLEARVEEWFSGSSAKSYFTYDKAIGAVGAYPNEFFFAEQINDHHFTYGYWIRAIAEIALRDPAWAAKSQWGGMVDLLVADIATAERGRADFPFLRNFDPYEGHSWASGIGVGHEGNNQESSSEAVNAWAGLILWGEVSGDAALRDLGMYLYTAEIQGIQNYVFDIHHTVFAPEYRSVEVSQVFGGAYKHNTWWTDEPRQIKGINLLPVTTASLYLGRDPAYVARNLDALKTELETYAARGVHPSNPPPADIWQDIFAQYRALADPAAALKLWDRWGSFELGDTRTHALHWMLTLDALGRPDFEVLADTALYSVFRRADGAKTYLAFNAGKAPITVKFSDGKSLTVAPHMLGRTN